MLSFLKKKNELKHHPVQPDVLSNIKSGAHRTSIHQTPPQIVYTSLKMYYSDAFGDLHAMLYLF